jgi:hypothetical protein
MVDGHGKISDFWISEPSEIGESRLWKCLAERDFTSRLNQGE